MIPAVADGDEDDTELYDPTILRVDAVAGPATGLPFTILKQRLTGALSKEQLHMADSLRRPVTKDLSQPIPKPIEQLLEQLVEAFSAWRDTISDTSQPDAAPAAAPAAEPVEKALGRRYDRLLAQMPTRTAAAVRSAVVDATLKLALTPPAGVVQKSQGMTPGDATAVCQRVVLDLAAAHQRRRQGR